MTNKHFDNRLIKKTAIRAYQNVPHSLRQTEAEYNDPWKECNGWMEGIQANLWTSMKVFGIKWAIILQKHDKRHLRKK